MKLLIGNTPVTGTMLDLESNFFAMKAMMSGKTLSQWNDSLLMSKNKVDRFIALRQA